MIEEFNVDSKAECGQLNLAHVARNKKCELFQGVSSAVPPCFADAQESSARIVDVIQGMEPHC